MGDMLAVPSPIVEPPGLVAWLATHDAACPVCEYQLRGNPTAACPECGSGLELGVRAPGLRLGWWLLAIVSFALAAGFDGVVTILMSTMMVLHGPPRGAGALAVLGFLGTFAAMSVVCVALLLLTVRRRARWMRLGRDTQRRAAIAIFVAVLVTHSIVGLLLS